jgi:GAF domain-containing protein
MQVLGSFAQQASIALEKAHLYAENQRQLERLNRLLDELRSAQHQLAGPDNPPAQDIAAELAAMETTPEREAASGVGS